MAVWVQQEGVPDWIEASSCSCERVFSFVTSHDHGQSTQRLCEVLWIQCNGPCVEEWYPGEVFAELRATQFRPRHRVRRHIVDVEDNTLLCFEAFKDFSVPWLGLGCDVMWRALTPHQRDDVILGQTQHCTHTGR